MARPLSFAQTISNEEHSVAETVEEGLITEQMRAQVGVESASWTSEVDRTWVRMFARSVGHSDPVFYDETAAKAAGYRSLPCPPGYLGTPIFNPSVPAPRAASQPEPSRPLNRRLNGGTQIEYFDDLCAGDTLTGSSHIESFEETKGSLGAMLITVTQTVYKNQAGKVVAVSTGTGIRY
jgi:hypothetical protein